MHVSSQQLLAIVRSLICQVRALLAGLFGKSVMRKAVLSLASVYCFFTLLAFAAQVPASQPPKTTETIPVSQIHTGMRGVAYTVFQGTKPEPMDVEVLGVLKNMNGHARNEPSPLPPVGTALFECDTDHRLASPISLLFLPACHGRAARPVLTGISPRCSGPMAE